jgi:hypothetical protein
MPTYQDDKLVKRAYSKVSYTKEQIDELKACLDPITGPEYFITNFMYIQHPTRGREKLVLYPFQIDLIKTYHNYRKSVNMVSRQMGKCLLGDVEIKIRNKKTGVIQTLTFAEFEVIIKEKLGLQNE